MKTHLIFFFVFVASISFGQVGIGTTTPSNASMLEISSSNNNLAPYRGLMPPRIPSSTNLIDIPAGPADVGLLVFVIDTGSLQIWNGISWEVVYSLNTTINVIAGQDFDSDFSWTYTNTPVFYYNPALDDIWGVIATFMDTAADSDIDTVNSNFLGCRDLDNPTSGPNVDHIINFDTISVVGFSNVRMSFDYDIFEFDAGDDVDYIVYYDNVAQTQVNLINGVANLSAEGTVTLIIPPGVSDVRLDLIINQNGNDDYAGFDNFRIYSL